MNVKRESLEVRKRSIFSSSAESLESFDDSLSITTQEQLYDNIRLHKEIIQSVKLQPWSLSKKYKIVQRAKQYVAKHEDTLQERFAQSGNTKDLYARFKIVLADRFKYLKREFFNFCALLIPWEIRIKEIESRFGSVVASYFIFLRWLFWVNIVIANIFIWFVIVPEIMIVDNKKLGSNETVKFYERKVMLKSEREIAPNFLTVWDFEGFLKYSPIFYGYYLNIVGIYNLPIAYFLAGVLVYVYSFFATLRKMAENSRTSKLGSKEEECIFSWKLFTGWDYMIGHSETAANRIASVVLGFKEALLEEAEKQKDKKNWKTIVLRIFANINVIFLLVVSAYAVIKVVERSEEDHGGSWWRRNEITIVMSLISFIFPMLFEILGLIEYYHPRMQLRLQLARIMSLNLLNLLSLIWALFEKVRGMMKRVAEIELYQSMMENASMIAKTMRPPSSVQTPLSSTLLTTLTSTQSTTLSSTTRMTTEPTTSRDILTTTSSTIKSITEAIFDKMTEIVNLSTSTEYPLDDKTDIYDYSNPDYFEVDSSTINMFSSTTFTTPNDSMIYDDYANFTNDIVNITNATSEVLTNFNISNLINSVTPFFDMDQYYYDYYNDSDAVNGTNADATKYSNMLANKFNHYRYDYQNSNFDDEMRYLNASTKEEMRKLCWETMFGQGDENNWLIKVEKFWNKQNEELVKLTVMDLLLTVMQILMFDFFRALFVRYVNGCWCWDLEKKFPKYGDFKIAENILHLVNNQGMVWMGMFFSPGLAIINLIKLVLIMYLRSWAVLTCNVPHEVIFRASRSNNFYLTLLLTMLFLCVLPVSYAIVWVAPSKHCGPFSEKKLMYHLFTDTIMSLMPQTTHRYLQYFVSPAAIIPLLLLLILFIYYLISLTGALREANQDLKTQLHKERTEERKKMMKLMEDKINEVTISKNRLSARWKKVLDISKPPGTMTTPTITATLVDDSADRKKLLLTRAMKNILKKKYSNEGDGIPKITTSEAAEP